jgi:hypothetical protein
MRATNSKSVDDVENVSAARHADLTGKERMSAEEHADLILKKHTSPDG